MLSEPEIRAFAVDIPEALQELPVASKVTIREIRFILTAEQTEVWVTYAREAPDGAVVKRRRFPASRSVADILEHEIAGLVFLEW